MIRASDLMPLAGASLRPAAAPREGNGALNPASWFDGDALGADTCIGVALGAAGRGLSVAQHAERVLCHLCGDAPDQA
jgi:hypothetical protein